MSCFHKWISCGHRKSQPICKGTCGCSPPDRRLTAPIRAVLHWKGCLQLEPQSFHCLSNCFFCLPWKKLICPSPHTPSCLPTAPHHPKGGGFFGVNWLCLVSSSPFSAFLLLHQLPAVSASCSQTLFGGQTLKLCPSLPSSTTPLMSTQKPPGNSQGTSSITKSSAYLCVSFQQSYCDSRKSQLRL